VTTGGQENGQQTGDRTEKMKPSLPSIGELWGHTPGLYKNKPN
jgi:hypothetical protein